MKPVSHWLALFLSGCLVTLFALAGCNESDDDDDSIADDDDDGNDDDDDTTADCETVTALFAVGDLLASGSGPCFDWVGSVYGRAILDSIGTAVVFTRANQYQLGLMIGAMHTLGEGYFGAGGTDLPETMSDPAEQSGVARLQLIPQNGSIELPYLSAMFFLFHPELPAEENNNQLQNILPRHDFYAGIVDSQLFEMGGAAPLPEPLVLAPLPLYDPLGLTIDDPVIRNPQDDEIVLFLGYPRDGDLAGSLAAGAGRTLSNDEAEQVIAQLGTAGDVEGDIEYDPEVEFLIEGASVVGMSGSGVFDRDGNQIGLLVRASDVHDGTQYVRAVRLTFIMDSILSAFETLDPQDQDRVAPFLPDLEE